MAKSCYQVKPSVSKTKEYLFFLSAVLTKPFKMGAIAPSSKQLSEMMLLKLRPGASVVEIGPGTGAITRVIRQRLSNPDHYIGFDINREFVEQLCHEFPDLKFVQDSAENIQAHVEGRPVDYIVCSLPWNIWPSHHQEKILKGAVRPLKKGGHFATFAYWPMLYAPAGLGFRRLLWKTFKKVEVTKIVWGNLPPAVVYVCTR